MSRSWAWPNTVTGNRIPTRTDSSIVRVCRLGAASGAATTWDCEKANGTTSGSWSGNTGRTVADSFIEGQKAMWVGPTDGPQLTSAADVDSALNGAYTILLGWYANDNTLGWEYQATGTGIIQLVKLGANDLGFYDGDYATLNSARCLGGWCFTAMRSDGANSLALTVDGASASHAGAHTAISSGTHTFGNRSAVDIGISGYLMFVAFFNTRLSDAQVTQYRQDFYGVGNDAGVLGGSTGGGIYNASTGNVDFFTEGLGASSHHLSLDGGTVSGLLCSKGGAGGVNFMAADALAAATWVDVGGVPTVNSNVSSGPFAAYKNQGAECDEIVEADAAALRGKQSLTGGTSLGFYTCGSFLKAGLTGTTKTKARITFETDGTSSVSGCDITGLTSTATWFECQTQVTGSPTNVKCSFRVGNVAADTGSIQVCGGFANYAPNIELFRLTNAAVGASNYSLPASNLPTLTGDGKIVWIHTPLFDPNTEWTTNQGTYYMFDAATAGAHSITEIFGYTAAGNFYAQASSDTSFSTPGVGLTPLTPYATSAEWRSLGGGQCNVIIKHNACAGTATTCANPTTVITSGTVGCPTQPDQILLCDRTVAGVPSSLIYNAIRVYTVQ